jgi:hypothetical protein
LGQRERDRERERERERERDRDRERERERERQGQTDRDREANPKPTHRLRRRPSLHPDRQAVSKRQISLAVEGFGSTVIEENPSSRLLL